MFLVLVPHRDARLMMRKYSDALFKAGFSGAYCFPWVTPLAAASRPLTADELKNCARALRDASLASGGKITAGEISAVSFHGEALFGPRLDISPNAFDCKKIASIFSPLVIGACLMPDATTLPPPPKLSFRAAAVANMQWRPVQTENDSRVIGYKWKIGKLCWLPAVRKK